MSNNEPLIFGWREWVGLPELGISGVKAKIDTAVGFSTLHVFEVQPYYVCGKQRVKFKTYLNENDQCVIKSCTANIINERTVLDSSGHRERRWVIKTPLSIGPYKWPIKITLSSRGTTPYQMLLGRSAIKRWGQIDPSRSFLIGKKKI